MDLDCNTEQPIFGFLTKDGQIGNRPVTASTMLRGQTLILELRAGFDFIYRGTAPVLWQRNPAERFSFPEASGEALSNVEKTCRQLRTSK
jgi:hypothetical protein